MVSETRNTTRCQACGLCACGRGVLETVELPVEPFAAMSLMLDAIAGRDVIADQGVIAVEHVFVGHVTWLGRLSMISLIT